MQKALIIVESPTKIKTLKKFLGSNYLFESSMGHIRDLPEREFGIDIEHDFEPTYTLMPNKEEVVAKLKKAAKAADIIYLSPDPDREGEAIAWHITHILPKNAKVKRVTFNSITKDAVLKALENPRDIDEALVNAQQARRLLDRIVGYKISPILNRRIQRGKDSYVSAGRVQSVALKLVVDREKEIQAFKPTEYWNIGAILEPQTKEKHFKAYLYSVDGKKVEKEAVDGKEVFLIGNKETADQILKRMENVPYIVKSVERKEKKRNPVPPFITSTLQQEASRHYGYSSSRTMSIAQSLYEGVELGNGSEGLITYMRTDSVRVSPEAIEEARQFITRTYGKDYLPQQPKIYSTQKNSQDAHEAIRPANLEHTPEKLQPYLTKDQFQLYQLIWKRFISSQMMSAIYDTVSVDIKAGNDILLRATGSIIKFLGFLAVYEEKVDDELKDDENRMLPNLVENQPLHLIDLTAEQAFTRPPPRYTEASLVKELEKSGIGRPSTYATIMNKIQSRDYTVKENGRLKPTELGFVIAQMLETSFQQIMNIGFTATMEDDLELVAEAKKNWKKLIQDFWMQFYPTLEIAEKEAFVPRITTDKDCPKCGSKLQKVWHKTKYFYGCSKYPECDFSAPIEELHFNKEDYAPDFDWEQKCPICSNPMKVRHGKFGAFLGCTQYPSCKGIVNIPKKGEQIIHPQQLPTCPAIGCPGHLVARKSRFGKVFYSCSTYPECNVIVNTLEEIEKKYINHPRTPYVKKQKGKKGSKATTTTAKKSKSTKTTVKKKTETKPRNMPAYALSQELADIVGTNESQRTEVTKKIWDYIKEHKLQDEKNKRLIVPDEKLAKIFDSKEPIDMMKMAGHINKHLHKKEAHVYRDC
ncbi:DNA topoisomerase 1 [Candidatus Rubidus massiliensis]|nr:DNA topoisomerase 1 [Candidatus Rubidus massiliensis]